MLKRSVRGISLKQLVGEDHLSMTCILQLLENLLECITFQDTTSHVQYFKLKIATFPRVQNNELQ